MFFASGLQTIFQSPITPAISYMQTKSLIFFVLVFCHAINAEETNKYYLTDDGFLPFHHDQLLEEAKKAQESLPVKDFPEGNWGIIQDGFQLSLRFEKQTFTNGEPIPATLLLRNITNQDLEFLKFPAPWLEGPIMFKIASSTTGEIIPQRESGGGVFSGSTYGRLRPDSQVKYLERLNRAYDLTNGTYTVWAYKSIGFPTPTSEVKSAPVAIKIEDSPAK